MDVFDSSIVFVYRCVDRCPNWFFFIGIKFTRGRGAHGDTRSRTNDSEIRSLGSNSPGPGVTVHTATDFIVRVYRHRKLNGFIRDELLAS